MGLSPAMTPIVMANKHHDKVIGQWLGTEKSPKNEDETKKVHAVISRLRALLQPIQALINGAVVAYRHSGYDSFVASWHWPRLWPLEWRV